MSNSSSKNIPDNITATCPRCKHDNYIPVSKLQYFRDTLAPKGLPCVICGFLIPSDYFITNTHNKPYQSIMHG